MAPVTEHHDTLGDQPLFWRSAERRRAARALPARRADELRRLGGLPRAHGRAGPRPARLRAHAASAATATSRCRATTASSRTSSTTPRSSGCAWSCTTGARSGLLWAQRHPERVERLVVINAVPLLPGYRWHRVARALAHARASARWSIGLSDALGLAAAAPAARLADESWPHFDQGTQRAILQLYRASPEDALARAGLDLGRIDCPALVVWGDRDSYIPRALRRRLRGRARRRRRGAAPPRRRALALARPAGCRRSHRRVPGRASARSRRGRWPRVRRRRVYLVLAPPSADLAAQDYRADLGARAVGQRLVRRPPHARLQRALPAAGGRCWARGSSAALSAVAAAWLFERLCATRDGARASRRCGSRVATAHDPRHRAADLRAGRWRSALGAVLAAAARAPRLGRASLAALASLASPVAGAFVALAAAALVAGPPALVAGGAARRRPGAGRRAGRRLPRGRQLPVRRLELLARRSRRRSRSALVVPRDARVRAHRRRALRRGDGRELRAGDADGRQRRAPRRALRRAGARRASLWRTQPPRARPAGAAAAVLAVGRAGRRLGPRRRRRVRARALLRRAARLPGRAATAAAFRVEIPFTDNHWESRWVAPHVPLARGWERQVDRAAQRALL